MRARIHSPALSQTRLGKRLRLRRAAWRHLVTHASPTLTHVDAIAMDITPADMLVLERFQGTHTDRHMYADDW